MVDPLRGELHLLVFEQAAHEFGARVFGFLAGIGLLDRQQHARLDLDQHRRHQQIFGREFEIGLAQLVDVAEVLHGDIRHRDVEHVEVLLADQVQQQIQRAFERFEEDFERVRRDVQIRRQLEERLAVQARERNAVDDVGRRIGRGRGKRGVGLRLARRRAPRRRCSRLRSSGSTSKASVRTREAFCSARSSRSIGCLSHSSERPRRCSASRFGFCCFS